MFQKTLQLAKRQLGMSEEQAYCEHREFEVLFVHPVTLEPLERRCKKCKLMQRSRVVWEDVK